jgi:hypothetical protein
LWKFAAEPTLKSARDAINKAKYLQRKYESSLFWTSETDAFASLEQSLQDFILIDSLTAGDVESYQLTLHTEVALCMTNEFIARYFGGLLGNARRLGIVPEPKVLWQLQPWSFVFDWFIPMSQYIDDSQQYFASYNSPISTIGHSVYVRVETKAGWSYAIYIRSNNSVEPLDLVPQAWNKSSGAPAIAIPLAIVTLLGFRN